MRTLSETLKAARLRADLTQLELAKKSGLSQSTISDIERGRNESSRDLPAIASALGITVESLLSGVPPQPNLVIPHIFELPKSKQIQVKSFAQILNNEQGTDTMIVFGDLPEGAYAYVLELDHMEGLPVYIQRGAGLVVDPDLEPVEGDVVLANVSGPAIGIYSRVGGKGMLMATRDKIPAVEVAPDQVLGVVLKWAVEHRNPARK